MSEPAPPVLLCRRDQLDGDLRFDPGRTVVDGFVLPSEPWDLSPRRLMCVGRVDAAEVAQLAVTAVARGVGVAVSLELTGDGQRRFLEDIERLGASAVAPAPVSAGHLDADQAELLDALATGATLTAAAAALHLSRRTAHRRLAEARRRLGVDTTAEAVAARFSHR